MNTISAIHTCGSPKLTTISAPAAPHHAKELSGINRAI
jgi:hypothetical protein